MMFVILVLFSVVFCAQGVQECGLLSPNSTEFPWVAGIYHKSTNPPYFRWQNGGTLISNTVVLTAGHFFYLAMQPTKEDSVQKPTNLMVAVGKLTRPWSPVKGNTQMSEIKKLHLSPRFKERGSGAIPYFSDDIAIVIVAKPFRFTQFVQPICLNFEYEFEQQQFKKGNKGLAMGWKPHADELVIKELYYVVDYDCVESDQNEQFYSNSKFFTLALSDKVCIQAKENNSVPCKGDSGIGLVFPDNSTRYYLVGVYSSPLNYERICQTNTFYGFTSIVRHESFVRRYWNESALDVFIPPDTGKCVLPPYPEFGTYSINVTRVGQGDDGDGYVLVALTYSCHEGHGIQGIDTASCYNGFWPDAFPKCIRMCQLKESASVEYNCLVSGAVVGQRACQPLEPVGTLVSPTCRPHYDPSGTFGFMRCGKDGEWDSNARCIQECGKVTPDGKVLVVGGRRAQRGKLPWHAGLYRTTVKPYLQICGGSLISNKHIISAAHCFWTDLEKQLPVEQFAAAVGKVFRPWGDKMDDAQKSEVKEIHIPPRYGGSDASFQDDIAVVVVTTPFEFKTYIRPVCLSFDSNFDKLQLQTINKGKVAGWGLTGANGPAAGALQVLDMPYVEVGTCIDNSPHTFREYITSDKICAGALNGSTALCKGDSGGGLAFPTADRGTVRYYLRGVVSTAPKDDDNACNTYTYTSFTHLIKHADFIKQFWTEL